MHKKAYPCQNLPFRKNVHPVTEVQKKGDVVGVRRKPCKHYSKIDEETADADAISHVQYFWLYIDNQFFFICC